MPSTLWIIARTAAAALLAVPALAVAAPQPARAATCDRACLTTLLDDYFAALAAGDPARLKAAANLRHTDNGRAKAFAPQSWQVQGAPVYRLDAVDPAQGQAAANAVVMSGGKKAIVFVRLRAAGQRVGELETVIVHQGVGQKSLPDNLSGAPVLFHHALPAAERVSRRAMIAAADSYLTALSTSGTDHYRPGRLADDLVRVENGMQTSGGSFGGRPPMSVAQQLANMPRNAGFSMRVTDRRYPLVDERTGTVLAIGLMHLDLAGPDMPGLHSVPKQNRVQTLIEFMKIVRGKVQRIQAVMLDLDEPDITTPGW